MQRVISKGNQVNSWAIIMHYALVHAVHIWYHPSTGSVVYAALLPICEKYEAAMAYTPYVKS